MRCEYSEDGEDLKAVQETFVHFFVFKEKLYQGKHSSNPY
jgi:hypothetical protein